MSARHAGGALLLATALTAVAAGATSAEHTPRTAWVSDVAVRAHRAPVARHAAVRPLTVSPPSRAGSGWTSVASVDGQPAVWLSQRAGVTLLRLDQSLVRVDLHAGSSDGGVSGWRYGDSIEPAEIHSVIAAVNGGFRLTYSDVGFLSGGHVAVGLKSGLASIVTYADGSSDVGAWRAGVPAAGRAVYSVLQNQRLLVDRGALAASADGCIISCWGETVAGALSVARSAIGVRADGQLIWAAGEELLPSQLGAALIRDGAVRAMELGINPDWVAGYLYVHHPGGPSAVPLIPGQLGIAGGLLQPYSRDFLTFVAR